MSAVSMADAAFARRRAAVIVPAGNVPLHGHLVLVVTTFLGLLTPIVHP
jgi:hypothetical protein